MKVILTVAAIFLIFFSDCNGLSHEKTITLHNLPKRFSGTDVIEIPFIYSRNLILVKGSIDDQAGYWILDTGTPKLVINNRYVKGSHALENMLLWDALGNSQQLIATVARDIKIGGLHFRRRDAHTCNLFVLEKERHVTLLGLAGLQIWDDYYVTINSREQVLILSRKPSALYPPCDEQIAIPFTLSANKMLIKAAIGDRKYKLLFDTAAEISLLSHQVLKWSAGHFKHDRYRRLITTESIGSAQEGVLSELTISNLIIANLRVVVHHFEKVGNGIGESLHGAIGHELLKIGVVTIDFKSRQLTIIPFASNRLGSAETKKATLLE